MVKFKIYGVKNFKDQAHGKAEKRWLICFTSLVLGLLSGSYHTYSKTCPAKLLRSGRCSTDRNRRRGKQENSEKVVKKPNSHLETMFNS